MKKVFGIFAVLGLWISVCAGQSIAPQGTTFESWADYVISSTLTSPATAQSGDISSTFLAPNGQNVHLVAKVPHPTGGTLDLSGVTNYWPYTPGTDARPLFDAAIAMVKQGGYGTLTIPTGTYTFTSTEPSAISCSSQIAGCPTSCPSTDPTANSYCSAQGQWLIAGLNNVVIQGTGNVKLVFTNTIDGIYVTNDVSMSLKNINISFDPGRNMNYVARMTQVGSSYELIIPSAYNAYRKYALSANDLHTAKILPFNTAYASGGPTPYLPGGSVQPSTGPNPGQPYPKISLAGTLSFDASTGGIASTKFDSTMVGLDFIVFEDSGGNAINVKDTRVGTAVRAGTLPQSADLQFSNITINSAPTFGIGVLGVARGLIVQNFHIMPGASSVVSTNYDGIHVAQAGGDVFISNNTISQQGDDGINLAFTPQYSYSYTTTTDGGGNTVAQVGLANFARLIVPGDSLSFFDRQNNYLGTQTVATSTDVPTCPTVTSGSTSYNLTAYGYNHCATVTLNGLIPGLTTQTGFQQLYVRDNNIIGGRMQVINNTVQNCNCHGVLEQNPNAKVASNTLTNTSVVSIRLLSNLGAYYNFQEGVGALNVNVSGNTINGVGTDQNVPGSPQNNSYGAISVQGIWANGYLAGTYNGNASTNMVNRYVAIQNNTVSNANQDCIFVDSTELGNVTSNTCTDTNLARNVLIPGTAYNTPSVDGILIYYSNPGTLGAATQGSPGANMLSGSTTGPITQNHANYIPPTN